MFQGNPGDDILEGEYGGLQVPHLYSAPRAPKILRQRDEREIERLRDLGRPFGACVRHGDSVGNTTLRRQRTHPRRNQEPTRRNGVYEYTSTGHESQDIAISKKIKHSNHRHPTSALEKMEVEPQSPPETAMEPATSDEPTVNSGDANDGDVDMDGGAEEEEAASSPAGPDDEPEEKTTEETAEDENDDDDDDDEQAPEVEEPQQETSTIIKKKKRKKSNKRKRHLQHKIFQDTFSFIIPLDVTADLRIAIQKTRIKRIKSIYKRFPALKKETKKPEDDKDDPMLEDEDDENKDKDKESKAQKKKKKLAHVPHPDQYGSVLDYLEAKYVRGVQLGDEDDDNNTNNNESVKDDVSEGHGSVYSHGSFLDDTDLQRDVAEQVMANTTMTKVELEEDDADFFVNVGNLEVEDNQYGDHYDPLQDKESTSKKRKKSQGGASASGTPTKKKKKKAADAPDSEKSKKSTTSTGTQKKKKSTTAKSSKDTEKKKALIAAVKKAKAFLDSLLKKVVASIKKMSDEELPRRRTKLKVALTCPPNKKPGDDITFT
jgi:hypothetical protein